MAQELRIGVVGLGFCAQRMYLPSLAQMEGARAVALVDTNAERLRECAEGFGIERRYTDYRAMLADGELDAVIVVTPNAFHAPVTIAALEAGCHVLVEKPMATTGDESQRMADAAEAHGRVLSVNLPRRARAVYAAAQRLIRDGELGEVYQAVARIVRRSGIPGYGSWFTTAALSGGGALLDTGVHILDVLLWTLDEPEVVAVSAVTTDRLGRAGRGQGPWGVDHNQGGTFDVEDGVFALLRCANGLSITLDVTWAAYATQGQGLQLRGTRGGLTLTERPREPSTLEIYTDGPDGLVALTREVPLETPPASEGPLRGFLDAIRHGTPPLVPATAGVRLARLCDAIYESARSGREVRLG